MWSLVRETKTLYASPVRFDHKVVGHLIAGDAGGVWYTSCERVYDIRSPCANANPMYQYCVQVLT